MQYAIFTLNFHLIKPNKSRSNPSSFRITFQGIKNNTTGEIGNKKGSNQTRWDFVTYQIIVLPLHQKKDTQSNRMVTMLVILIVIR